MIGQIIYLVITFAFAFSVDAEPVMPGDVICTAGFVMDAYHIDKGSDKPGVIDLEEPEDYPVSNLVDIKQAAESEWHILEAPEAHATTYGTGWKVLDNSLLVELVRKVGICESCSGSEISKGFQVEVTGTVTSVDPLTIDVTEARVGSECASTSSTNAPSGRDPKNSGTQLPTFNPTGFPTKAPSTDKPTKEPTSKAPSSERPTKSPTSPAPTKKPSIAPTQSPMIAPSIAPTPTKTPTAAPSTGAPSTSPSAAPSMAPTPVNCSFYQETFQVPELPVTIRYFVNIDEVDNTKSTLSAQVIYEGKGWLGFGISPSGGMNGSSVIIGSVEPSETVAINPGKYYLGGHAEEFVSVADMQTLAKESITYNKTHTILEFTKFLQEEGEPAIDGYGPNRFVVAYGFNNKFAYHKSRASFVMALSPCVAGDYNYSSGNYTTSNYTDSNATDSEEIIIIADGNPDSIPFDGEIDGGFENGTGIGVGDARVSGNDGQSKETRNYRPADAYAASQSGKTDEVPISGAIIFKMSSLMVGLAGVLLML